MSDAGRAAPTILPLPRSQACRPTPLRPSIAYADLDPSNARGAIRHQQGHVISALRGRPDAGATSQERQDLDIRRDGRAVGQTWRLVALPSPMPRAAIVMKLGVKSVLERSTDTVQQQRKRAKTEESRASFGSIHQSRCAHEAPTFIDYANSKICAINRCGKFVMTNTKAIPVQSAEERGGSNFDTG